MTPEERNTMQALSHLASVVAEAARALADGIADVRRTFPAVFAALDEPGKLQAGAMEAVDSASQVALNPDTPPPAATPDPKRDRDSRSVDWLLKAFAYAMKRPADEDEGMRLAHYAVKNPHPDHTKGSVSAGPDPTLARDAGSPSSSACSEQCTVPTTDAKGTVQPTGEHELCYTFPQSGLTQEGDEFWANGWQPCTPRKFLMANFPTRRPCPPPTLPEKARELLEETLRDCERVGIYPGLRKRIRQYLAAAPSADKTGYEVAAEWRDKCHAAESEVELLKGMLAQSQQAEVTASSHVATLEKQFAELRNERDELRQTAALGKAGEE